MVAPLRGLSGPESMHMERDGHHNKGGSKRTIITKGDKGKGPLCVCQGCKGSGLQDTSCCIGASMDEGEGPQAPINDPLTFAIAAGSKTQLSVYDKK